MQAQNSKVAQRARRADDPANYISRRFHSTPVRVLMPGKRPSARQGIAVKEYFRPSPTKDPIDVDRYGGKWVAIWRREIIDADADLERLMGRLKRRGLEEKAGLFRVPRSGLIIG